MIATELRKLLVEDRALRVGQPVRVRWGYGLGFRAEGWKRIAALYPKSVRVELLEDVQNPSGRGIGWPKGFVLKGIPRFGAFNRTWDRWNSVDSLPEAAPAAGQDGGGPPPGTSHRIGASTGSAGGSVAVSEAFPISLPHA